MARTDDDKARRLAEALRHNLRRRKAQARGEEDRPGDGVERADQTPAVLPPKAPMD